MASSFTMMGLYMKDTGKITTDTEMEDNFI